MGNGQNLKKNTVSVIFIIVFILLATHAYAADFKDVPSSHWAKPYIDKMSDARVVAGYDGNLFKPSKDVSRLESLVFVSRLLNVDNNEKANAKLKYGVVLNELGIPEWAKESVAICLAKDVISPTDLISLNKLGMDTPAKKIDITEYLVRAMGLVDLANEKTLIALPFVDAMSIDKSKDKYVAVLVDLKIIQGDDKNRFNPDSNVKRDVMVTMLSKSYDEMRKTPEIPQESLETRKGIVKQVLAIGEQPYLTIEEGLNNNIVYRIDRQNTIIYVDKKKGTIEDIAEGQNVKITVVKDERIAVSIDIESISEEYIGKIKFLYTNAYPPSNKLTLEHEKGRDTHLTTFDIDNNAKIYLDENIAHVSGLKEGYIAKLKVRNNKVYEIDARSKNKVMEGILKHIEKEDDSYYLTVTDSKGKSYEYEVHEDLSITRNKKKAYIEDLRPKDEVYIELEYDRVVDIEAKVVKREIEGFVTLVSNYLYKNTEISVMNLETKEEETFILGKDPYIKVDNKVTNSYDIKPGYYVEIILEGDEISELYADSRSIGASITGKIKSINYRKDSMVITSRSIHYEDFIGEEITVYLNDDAIIWDSKSNRLYFDDLYRNDTVTVTGSYDGSTFMANRIILE